MNKRKRHTFPFSLTSNSAYRMSVLPKIKSTNFVNFHDFETHFLLISRHNTLFQYFLLCLIVIHSIPPVGTGSSFPETREEGHTPPAGYGHLGIRMRLNYKKRMQEKEMQEHYQP